MSKGQLNWQVSGKGASERLEGQKTILETRPGVSKCPKALIRGERGPQLPSPRIQHREPWRESCPGRPSPTVPRSREVEAGPKGPFGSADCAASKGHETQTNTWTVITNRHSHFCQPQGRAGRDKTHFSIWYLVFHFLTWNYPGLAWSQWLWEMCTDYPAYILYLV